MRASGAFPASYRIVPLFLSFQIEREITEFHSAVLAVNLTCEDFEHANLGFRDQARLDSIDIGELPAECINDIVIRIAFEFNTEATFFIFCYPPGPQCRTFRILVWDIFLLESDEIGIRGVAVRMELLHVVFWDVVLIAPPKARRQPKRYEPVGTGEFHHNRIVIGCFDFHGDTVDLTPDRRAVLVSLIKAELIIVSERGRRIRMSIRPLDSLAEMQR